MDLYERHAADRLSPDTFDLCIRLFGEFSVTRAGLEVDTAAWRFRNSMRLVQILALAPAHRIHREQVIDWFWPHAESKPASNSFHQVLHHARRALKSIGLGGNALWLERNVLSLQPDDGWLWTDVGAFEAAAEAAQGRHDPVSYRLAIDLYRGELLPEARYADWATSRRDALRTTYLSLLLNLAEIYEACGAMLEAEKSFTRLVENDAANERGHTGLMRVYACTGRRHQSIAQFRRLEEVSRRELDIAPSPQVRALRDSIGQGSYPP